MALIVESAWDASDSPYVLDVAETGGGGASDTITINTGKKFLTKDPSSATGDFSAKVTSHTAFLTDLQTALNAASLNATYTVSLDISAEVITIAASGGGVTAVQLTATTYGELIGQAAVMSGALSHTMPNSPEHWIKAAVGFWADWSGMYEDDENIAFDVVAHDGTPYGEAKDGVALHLDFSIPLEPKERVFDIYAPSTAPWTWQRFWKHCRNVKSVSMDDGTNTYFLRLREGSAAFAPRARANGYIGHWDLGLATRVLATI